MGTQIIEKQYMDCPRSTFVMAICILCGLFGFQVWHLESGWKLTVSINKHFLVYYETITWSNINEETSEIICDFFGCQYICICASNIKIYFHALDFSLLFTTIFNVTYYMSVCCDLVPEVTSLSLAQGIFEIGLWFKMRNFPRPNRLFSRELRHLTNKVI